MLAVMTYQDQRPRRIARVLALACAGGMLAALAACQARVHERPRQPRLGEQGAAWESVFATPFVQQRLGDDQSQYPEHARADAALAHRPPQPILATREWPEPQRPSLTRPRRVYLQTRPETLLFFEPDPGAGSRRSPTDSAYRWWW